jgi:hypothetical protein
MYHHCHSRDDDFPASMHDPELHASPGSGPAHILHYIAILTLPGVGFLAGSRAVVMEMLPPG